MTETARYSQLMVEDIGLGTGTRSVRLADGGTYTLNEVHVDSFLTRTLFRINSSNGASVLTATARLAAGARVWGVTASVITTFGNSGGLTGLLIGDGGDIDRWTSTALGRTSGSTSNQSNFTDASLMIYPSATDLLVTAVGGTFDADGVLELCIFASTLRHPS